MRNSCSENFLLEQLKAKLQWETGREAEMFDEALRWWKHTCGVQISGSEEVLPVEPFSLKNLKEHDKLPAGLHRRIRENEAQMGIHSVRCVARVDNTLHDGRVNLRVGGTFVGTPGMGGITVMVMIYNGRGELMDYKEAGYTVEYEGEQNVIDEFFSLPSDEWISAIETRFMPETVIF